MTTQSRYIVYVDESGDHGPASPSYPVFVLAFCIFEKASYAAQVAPLMQEFKFKHFGHDTTVLHEREIRKALSPFDFPQNRLLREAFMNDLSRLIAVVPFSVVAVVIDKRKLKRPGTSPENAYHLALLFGLEHIETYRRARNDEGRLHVVFEKRGRREDNDLTRVFHRVRGTNAIGTELDLEPVFAHKQANHCGLQLADLVARPIGLHVLRPGQPNRAYDLLEPKLHRSPEGSTDGWGLKVFP